LRKEGFLLQGINGLLWGNIPLEAGLSSSAALEISVINCLDRLFRLNLSPEKKAFLAQRAENDFVGVKCGVMDQFISVFGQKNKAMFLDCETLRFELIPLNLKNKLSILVYDSQVQRELATSQYNKRRQEADLALSHLKKNGYESFKDVNLIILEKMRKTMEEIIYRRTKHIVSENTRVNSAVQALREDDFHLVGELLFLSHESLRNDYEVSCPELDLLYETGKDFSGCLGARLTGAGFGGSGIALVKKEKVENFKEKAIEAAQKKAFPEPKIFEISIGEGASTHCLAKERKK
jgi:galactokinase